MPVASDGTYSFGNLDAGTYSVVINQSSTANSTPSLPAGWVNTGEHNGTGSGSDGNPNGISAPVTLSTGNVSNINFGAEQLPTANPVAALPQPNPGGGNATVMVPTLNGSDPEQGALSGTGNADTIIINTLPTDGTLYYNGVAVAAGDTIKNYNPSLLTVDPNSGAGTVSFTYSEVDAALKASTPATVSMDFTAFTISGNVLDDANGMQDSTVNGTGTNAGGTLYAQLLDGDGNAIATTPVASDGTYSFANLDAGTYNVVINQSSTANSTPSLPAGWVNTGEHNGTGTGSDGNPNGISGPIIIAANETSNVIDNINFGADQTPTANAITTTKSNPGGTSTVVVPALSGSDPEQGALTGIDKIDTVIINTVPANGVLYYNGIAVMAGDTIKNYDPSLLAVDPTATGTTDISFTYSEVDAALIASAPATVTIHFESPLPVVLVSFTTQLQGDKVQLNWSSSTEINVGYYLIERSTDGIHFDSVGLVNAKGSLSAYAFEDAAAQQGVNYYRLKIIDNNGAVTYSTIKMISGEQAATLITSIAPNPFIDKIIVTVQLPKPALVQIKLFDDNGRFLSQTNAQGIAGINRVAVENLAKLPVGAYIMQITTGNTITQKTIIKSR